MRHCAINIHIYQVGEAMQKLCDRKNVGKIILDPAAEPRPKVSQTRAARTASCDIVLAAVVVVVVDAEPKLQFSTLGSPLPVL